MALSKEPRVNDPRRKTGEYPPARLLLPGGLDGPWPDQARAWRLERRDFAQRSTYFEVKAGRGGKRARRRVDRYLRKLQI